MNYLIHLVFTCHENSPVVLHGFYISHNKLISQVVVGIIISLITDVNLKEIDTDFYALLCIHIYFSYLRIPYKIFLFSCYPSRTEPLW
jgi:hypothetical protein